MGVIPRRHSAKAVLQQPPRHWITNDGISIMTDYGMSVTVDMPLDQALDRAREALGEQGFGILTEIDVAATLQTLVSALNPEIMVSVPGCPELEPIAADAKERLHKALAAIATK
jgi:hypothetical protein